MSLLPNLLRSLLITGVFSFLAPVCFFAVLWAILAFVGYLPYIHAVGEIGLQQLSMFLSVFGNGSTLRGNVVIGLVCCSVGILFDTYTFYRYQKLNG